MTQVLRCCPAQYSNQPYIGVDQRCTQPAIFCIQHSPHKNTEGLMHQMLPLKHFKKTLQQKKFLMNQKIGILIDQYNNLMDSLIQEIRQLKLRKNIEFSMLWLRQLAKDQEEYELMRQIYRMDFKDLTCALVHSIYFKIVHNQVLEKKALKEINCYKGIAQILENLSQERQTRTFLSKKIAQIEGILQNGEILKRALPDKLVFKENIKEVLLQCPQVGFMDIKYNKCRLTKNSRQYISIFSKYPIVHNALYHINFSSKYTNVMLGICTQTLINTSKGQNKDLQNSQYEQSGMSNQSSAITQFDKHYSKESLVFNCTNGCVYKDGMFESGSNALTKGQKELVLKMRITSTNELIILLGKNVLCRQKIDNLISRNQGKQENTKFYLHVLMRTQGDAFDVDRDKDVSGDELPHKFYPSNNQDKADPCQAFLPINPRQNINFDEIKRRNQEQVINVNNLKDQIISGAKAKQMQPLPPKPSQSQFSYDFKHLNSSKLMAQLNAQSGPSLRQEKQQQSAREDAVKKQVKKLQEKRKQPQDMKPAPSYKKLNDFEKQQKINEIIKKQRIDKILNDLKSKPVHSSDSKGQPSNTIVARKLKQIHERKVTNSKISGLGNQFAVNNQQNAESSKYKRPSSNEQEEYNGSNLIMLKPVTVHNNFNEFEESLYQASSQNNDQPLFNSYDINPLLVQKKPNQFNAVTPKSNPFSGQSIKIPIGQNNGINTNKLGFQQENYEKEMTKLRPSQKIFKLQEEDDSSQFDRTGFKDDSVDLNGAATPIDEIRDFQFAKKSTKLNPSKGQEKKTVGYKKDPTSLLPPLHEDEEKHEESHIMQMFDVSKFQRMGSPKISINEGLRKPGPMMMAQLKQSNFSKMTSQQNLSSLKESFGGQYNNSRRVNTEQKKNKNEGMMRVTNPMNRMAQIQSVINIDIQSGQKSGYSKSDHSVHIANILGPQYDIPVPKSHDQSYINRSFDQIDHKDSNKDQSIINIRGTLFGLNGQKMTL